MKLVMKQLMNLLRRICKPDYTTRSVAYMGTNNSIKIVYEWFADYGSLKIVHYSRKRFLFVPYWSLEELKFYDLPTYLADLIVLLVGSPSSVWKQQREYYVRQINQMCSKYISEAQEGEDTSFYEAVRSDVNDVLGNRRPCALLTWSEKITDKPTFIMDSKTDTVGSGICYYGYNVPDKMFVVFAIKYYTSEKHKRIAIMDWERYELSIKQISDLLFLSDKIVTKSMIDEVEESEEN